VTSTNDREPDYDRLLNLKALSTWTLDRQREHATDRAAYEAALASFQSSLRSQHIDGDGKLAAARRSRKVEKHLKALVKASRKAEAANEALRNTYAGHVAHVAALPAQREAKALKRGQRRAAIGGAAAKSLHKTAAAVTSGDAQETAPAPAADGARGITDLWQQNRSAS
jgi:hypothetical protein